MIHIKEDIPIDNLTQDELGRKNLVLLMVDAIKGGMAAPHRALTFGVYGAWGEGKTSLMKMVKAELDKENIMTMWYNPWSVVDETKILVEFFAHLSAIAFNNIAITSAIENYGRLFMSVNDGGSYSPVTASYLTRLSHCLPAVGGSLSDLKASISEKLKEENKYPVVFIDDADRLSNNEIRIVFKLIRQIADFDNVTYIVGLDPAAVADALESSSGAASKGDRDYRGRSFLEKIIQVPIILPSLDETTVKRQIRETLLGVAKEFNIELNHKDVELVSETLSGAFLTKRSIMRFGNQLSFVLPVLHKETEFVDLCLMEALKYLNEQGWLEIYRQKNNLLGEIPYIHEEKEREKVKKERFDFAVSTIVAHYAKQEQVFVEKLLRDHLFTRIHHYGTDLLSKSINNKIYSNQYFICGVPDGIIPRDEASSFAKLIWDDQQIAIDWINDKLQKYSSDEIDRTARLTLEMVARKDSVEMAARLCRVLSFSDLAKDYTKFLVTNPNTVDSTITAVIIPRYMVQVKDGQRIPDRVMESVVLKDIYKEAHLNFCMNVFYGVYSDHCFTPDDEKGVFDILKERVLKEGSLSIFEYSYFIAQQFLLVWKNTDQIGYTDFLNKVLENGRFDAGSFVVKSLEANSPDGQLTAVAAITNLFSVVWDSFMEGLKRYKDKENRLFKLFIFNCESIRKEFLRNNNATVDEQRNNDKK